MDSIATATALVRALVGAGVEYVVHCPGSRCAPLAYVLAAAEKAGWLRVDVHIDERGAGFMALGAALATRRPAAVVTTSGTAVANLYPALLEASHCGIPLVAVTADRPHDLIGGGANQTTFQTGIFGPLIHTVSIPAGPLSEGQARLAVRRALGGGGRAEAGAPGVGPGHINIHFQTPLQPPAGAVLDLGPRPQLRPLRDAAETPRWHTSAADLDAARAALLAPEKRGRIAVIAGDKAAWDLPELPDLCAQAGWPLLAEPSSGLRWGPAAQCAYQDSDYLAGFDTFVTIGHPTLSRPITAALARAEVVTVAGWQGVCDPGANLAAIIDAANLRQILAEAAADPAPAPLPVPARDPQADAQAALAAARAACPEPGLAQVAKLHLPFEGGEPPVGVPLGVGAHLIWQAHCEARNSHLLIGASNTIRAFDLRALPAATAPGPVYANRGLAGIDGTLATGFGIAAVSDGPLRVVVGDVTFLHDLSTLTFARSEFGSERALQVIIFNDGGGSIFGRLEHGEVAPAEVFEKFFRTRRDVNIAALAVGCSWEYTSISNVEEFSHLLQMPIRNPQVVEVFSTPTDLG